MLAVFFLDYFLHHLAITFAFPLNHMNSWEKCLALQRGEMMWYFTRCIYCSFLILKGWAVTISSHWLWSKLQLLCLAVLAEGYCLKFGSVLNHVNLLHTCVIARIVTTNMDPRPQPQSNRQLWSFSQSQSYWQPQQRSERCRGELLLWYRLVHEQFNWGCALWPQRGVNQLSFSLCISVNSENDFEKNPLCVCTDF